MGRGEWCGTELWWAQKFDPGSLFPLRFYMLVLSQNANEKKLASQRTINICYYYSDQFNMRRACKENSLGSNERINMNAGLRLVDNEAYCVKKNRKLQIIIV